VTGYEWSDLNGDGVREPGEPVLGGMTVELWQPSKGGPEAQSPQPASQAPGDGTLVATTTTDENGYYHFDALMPGQYYVTFVKPSGTIWTWTNAGTDPALDSDVDPEISDQGAGPDQGRTDTFNVPLDDSADTVSAGVTEPAEVSGYLWYDANNNGLWDAGESPLANFLISFSGENNAAYGGVMTDENGYYDMVLPAGQCEVYQDLPWMMVQTSPLFSCTGGPGTGYQLDNAAGTVSENNNFALTQGGIVGCTLYQSQLSPKVWATVYGDLNDNGQLDPNEPSTTVWANGWEYYTRMPVGTWTLRSQSAGSYWISPSSTTITVYPGSYSYATFYATTQPSNLSGRVWRDANADGSIGTDESGLSGWSVFLDDNDNGQLDSGEATATTDADGNYTFVNVPPGWHTIREVLPGGYVQTSPGLGYYSTYVWPGQSTGDLNFGNQRTAPTGDFNNDGNVDAADIDLLYAHYGAANADTYDLDGDANVTQSDMDYLIHTIKNTWYGDANLDGKVGFGDFQALLDNWHATGTGWACGDFDGNGTTEYHDFQLLLDNWNPMGVHSPVTSGDSASSAATALATAAATAAPADTTVSVAAATTTAPLTVTPKAVTAMAAARPARTMNVLAGDALPTDLLAAPAARIAIPSTVRTPAAPAVRFGLGGFAPAASAQKFLAQVKLPRHHKALSVSVLNADDNTAPAGSVVRSVLERIV
jgi:protocatechuate 3,4-dioxygenase beta subunit